MNKGHYLSKEDIGKFVSSLKKEHKEAKEWIEEKRKEVSKEDRALSDQLDVANNHINYMETKREVSRKTARISLIERTLKDMSDFGYCKECGIEIGIERLSIDATFNRCFDCASIKDIIDRNYIKK
jgi:DnaK suppressor protein